MVFGKNLPGKNLPGKYHPEEKISSPAEKISPKVGKNPPTDMFTRRTQEKISSPAEKISPKVGKNPPTDMFTRRCPIEPFRACTR